MSDRLRNLKANAYDTISKIEYLQNVLGELNKQIKAEIDKIEADAKQAVMDKDAKKETKKDNAGGK